LTFLTGLILVSLQTYIHMDHEFKRMVQKSSNHAKVIGNRMANRITYEAKNKGFTEQLMVSLTAPYMADTLDQVEIYDQSLNLRFSRYIAAHQSDKRNTINSEISRKVIEDQFSHLSYIKESKHVITYFPIDFPVEDGEVLSRNTGIIYLVFDISKEYMQTTENILYSALTNIAIIIIMISVFSLLMYYLVFKRLNALYRATLMLAEGNFNIHVKSKGEDELTQVIHTFNSMAEDMYSYKNTMQELVDKAIKEQEEQTKLMIQQSRMASMGEMIGNIAHQWRQPLNALALLIQKLELFSQRGKLTDAVLSENVQKATMIINNMSITIDDFRDFFKPDKQKENFNLKDVVHDVMILLEAGLKESDISVIIEIDQPYCQVFGFKNEFSQVIINLINNSKDALNAFNKDDKTIYITGKQKRSQVVFKIRDNAGGIPEHIINRIFEPYYTTKEEGQGTGIGLYMSKMIVEDNMGGIMQVKNSEDGAEFSMVFKNRKGK